MRNKEHHLMVKFVLGKTLHQLPIDFVGEMLFVLEQPRSELDLAYNRELANRNMLACVYLVPDHCKYALTQYGWEVLFKAVCTLREDYTPNTVANLLRTGEDNQTLQMLFTEYNNTIT